MRLKPPQARDLMLVGAWLTVVEFLVLMLLVPFLLAADRHPVGSLNCFNDPVRVW
jgi:hypothetical protein